VLGGRREPGVGVDELVLFEILGRELSAPRPDLRSPALLDVLAGRCAGARERRLPRRQPWVSRGAGRWRSNESFVMTNTKRLAALRKAIGQTFDVCLGDVGAWDVDGLRRAAAPALRAPAGRISAIAARREAVQERPERPAGVCLGGLP
jgi:hypothetical protein